MFLENAFILPNTILGVIHINSAEFEAFDNYLAISIAPQFIMT